MHRPESPGAPRRLVLFVDDEPDVTKNLSLLMRKQSFQVRTANSADEALAILAAEPVDVVVSDERMPEMCGSDFLTLVRREHPDVTRIILTGQASVEATVKAINDAAVFRFLNKPIGRDELLACLREALVYREQREHAASGDARAATSERAQLHARLDDVLGGLWMAYQPVYAARDRRLVAYEALVRPGDPASGGPDQMIDLATGLDRLPDLEAAISERIGRDLASAPEGVDLLVNLHPDSLNQPSLFDDDHPLHRHSARILLEITERASLDTITDIDEKLAALRGRGYRIAIDDLGAGYSGLTSFTTLRPDVVKFDMELIRDIDSVETKTKLVRSMTALCRELGMRTVAEGIETKAELDAVVALGCDLLQGYYLAKPAKPFIAPAGFEGEDD
ncbi:MAG: EAL domain-containing protein [Myxococcales bacterium]|nr:EAL domain-containing protein [Myxococcales bacterium]